jgi:hypothetical protein
MEEIWKSCYEDYEISNLGNCRRKLLGGGFKEIKGSILNRGYRYFQVSRDGKRINKLFHHLVAEQFLGERPDNNVIDHIDRNSLNNNVSNLRYVTQKENMKNTDRYLTHIIEDDPKKRAIIREKEYVEKNREIVLAKKKEYYQKNKSKFSEYYENIERISYECEKCNKTCNIKKTNFKKKKTKLCGNCSRLKNLP